MIALKTFVRWFFQTAYSILFIFAVMTLTAYVDGYDKLSFWEAVIHLLPAVLFALINIHILTELSKANAEQRKEIKALSKKRDRTHQLVVDMYISKAREEAQKVMKKDV